MPANAIYRTINYTPSLPFLTLTVVVTTCEGVKECSRCSIDDCGGPLTHKLNEGNRLTKDELLLVEI